MGKHRAEETTADTTRRRVEVLGAVQGVGFRPFVYRLAREQGLAGWVVNDVRGVELEVEGRAEDVLEFERRLRTEHPPLARVHKIAASDVPANGDVDFEIRHSVATGDRLAMVLPDVATCADCMAEVNSEADRRAGYVFTNCTNCGPRFSIIHRLPYDRPATSMADFALCDPCRAEYEDPADRRFHAQPIACPECGPRLWLLDHRGAEIKNGDPISAAVTRIAEGAIVALKGLGGFLLLADAADAGVVTELRRRKRRPSKPFACMVEDLDAARRLAHVNDLEARLLTSPEAPIVLLVRRDDCPLPAAIAPGNPRIGLMLPYTPVHHRIARATAAPLIATSGNLADEPICIDNDEARERLGGIADHFLVHDRPIVRHVDDSVVWVLDDQPQTLRRARGLAPLPVTLPREQASVLAVGAHLKNTVALGIRDQVFISQHIGDMETAESVVAFERVIADFLDLYATVPAAVAHDLHPDYASSRWAQDATAGRTGPAAVHGLPLIAVQHHHAHLASCLAEHNVDGEALGIIWDGAGLGTDGAVWGGEFLVGDAGGYRRIARLRPFALPGGDAAARQPRRVALALLADIDPGLSELGDAAVVRAFESRERELVLRMITRGVNTPLTSSVGRLFDAVAAITGAADRISFEGEAAMRLEFAAAQAATRRYELPLRAATASESPLAARVGEQPAEELLEIDWRPLVAALVRDVADGVPVVDMAAGFHRALADAAIAVAERAGVQQVVLSGGCFQNRRLQRDLSVRLADVGCSVLVQRQVPANDGGVSLGQAVIAAARLERAEDSASTEAEGN